jgi:hypothetical protein
MKRIHAHRIEPSGLGRRDKNHGYEFCSVMYQPSSPDERHAFSFILYFRNVDRNIYGRIDYSTFTTSQSMRAIANKLELVSKLVLKRNRARSPWARPEVEKARRRAEARREPFSPTTPSHGLRSRLQPETVLKPVLTRISHVDRDKWTVF